MSSLGTFLILTAFVLASGAFAASIAGARRQRQSLIDGGNGLYHTVTALLLVASAIIIHAFVIGDYRIKYVQHYSNAEQPLFYKLASYWGGLDGSLLFWATLLAAFGSVAVYVNRERHRLMMPWVVACLSVVQMFFLFLLVIHNNPFETFLMAAPAAGEGLNPLLQNFYMAIHPPLLYLGFVGMTIPFAFGIAALASGQLDDSWLRAVRTWTMTAWLFLTVGLSLGALWAYEELGWGGYWGWDPVENAGLLPWFTATAFLHSVMVQERRGMLKVWNVSLVIVTFFLTIFGTFLTRSGLVSSVHAFGEDPELAWMFTVFMVFILVVSFGLVAYRMPLLRSRNELDSWTSREAAFLANNWVLLFSAFFVVFATMFPTLSEAIRGERLTVGPPFFDKWMTPIGFILLFLTGVGPLLAWRRSTLSHLRDQFLWSVLGGVVTGLAVVALGVPFWAAGLCFALCAFVTVTILQEFVRGAVVRRQATGSDLFTSLVGLFARSRRRYGGYVIHLGIVLVFLGFAGNGFKREEQVKLQPGQQVAVQPYVVQYKTISVTDDGRKQMVTAHLEASKDGKSLGQMYPARWFFRGREGDATTEIALRRSFADDLYVNLAGYELETMVAILQVTVNPLVNWIWFGVGVMMFGTGICLLPERTFAFATKSVPQGAVTTSLILLMVLTGGMARLHGQHVELPQTVAVIPRSPVEKNLHTELVCMCGTCGRKRIGECTCSLAAQMREEVARLVGEGKSQEAVMAHFVAKYGSQEVLSRPIDRGFNRLAWFLPYLVGVVGAVLVGGIAWRWSHREEQHAADASAPAAAPVNAELETRLDDELRDLD
ncbi:MAG TPA: cytochrome c-type biogenesis CcmF C-terminal domain-containing protein [Vicinamibacterales bacterium]|nr:cytochrome c-type biogenesis CcmF C-terminal domain-containing protein [Vicinamibacterales bacterium]